MMKVFILETGQPDANGDIILPSAFKNLPKSVPLTQNFDITKKLGECEVYKEDGRILGRTAANVSNTNFGIGYQVIKSHQEGDSVVIDELKLHTVAILPYDRNDK